MLIMTVCVCVSPQEKEMEKQKILYQQARLHARGAAEMVLQMCSASKGSEEPGAKRKSFLMFLRPLVLRSFSAIKFKYHQKVFSSITRIKRGKLLVCMKKIQCKTSETDCNMFFGTLKFLSHHMQTNLAFIFIFYWPAGIHPLFSTCRFPSCCWLFSRSFSSGCLGPMVTCTLKLGISILNGGNVQVQQVR